MGEIVYASFGRKTTDGGKSRIRRKRDALRDINEPITVDDLVMDHADVDALIEAHRLLGFFAGHPSNLA